MRKLFGALAAGVIGLAAATALAGGIYTNGLPTVGPGTVNGTAATAPNGVVTQLPPLQGDSAGAPPSTEAPNPLIPVDVNRSSGGTPQTVAVSPLQLAATFAESLANTTTSTAANAVLNTIGALVTTEALTTGVGSTYTFTWTNSLVTTSSPACFAAMYSGSNTAGGPMSVTSSTVSNGVCTVVFTNNGTAALNGTMRIVLHL